MITGDADRDQDQALAHAQGSLRAEPDKSVRGVVVLKETELEEREEHGKNSLLNNIQLSELEEFWPLQVIMPHW